MLKISHNAGFFSCCSVKLFDIIQYFIKYKQLPIEVDSSELFNMYKINNKDITFDFFIHYDNLDINIKYEKDIYMTKWGFQFDNFNHVDYKYLIPFIKKYFSPSKKIINLANNLILKYNIDFNNCIGLYYRGTDKIHETQIDSFDNYYNKLNEIIKISKNKNIQILLQTDTSQFLDYMKKKCINKNIIIINENSTSYTNNGIHYEKTNTENYNDIKNFLATVLIISKCKYIICSSGNCSIWMMYYRGNSKNVYQNLNKEWL